LFFLFLFLLLLYKVEFLFYSIVYITRLILFCFVLKLVSVDSGEWTDHLLSVF
jgi:hypothetical protein